ncbi:PWI domain-containing protein, partial [Delitschia confertaspora ATCC 74209]
MATSVDKKLQAKTKFPPEFNQRVDLEKVNLDLMKKWIAERITAILKDEDDIVVETCFNMLEENRHPDIKNLQHHMTGFLGQEPCAKFCKELWNLMLSAQDSPQGVPKELLEAKKAEMKQEKV